MSERSAQHDTFVIERTFEATPARVFKAFADPVAKARWFSGTTNEWTEELREFNFRVGGQERLRGKWKSGAVSEFTCTYCDIVPDQRIVYLYEMNVGPKGPGPKISISLATIELKAQGEGQTHMKLTEQGVYLDGFDDGGGRERGTNELMNKLAESLRS